MKKALYDFELELATDWCIKLERKIQLMVPMNYKKGRRAYEISYSFNKLEELKWGDKRLCTRCKTNYLIKGYARLCIRCIKIAENGTEESLYL